MTPGNALKNSQIPLAAPHAAPAPRAPRRTPLHSLDGGLVSKVPAPARKAVRAPAAKKTRPRIDVWRTIVMVALCSPLVAINVMGARYYLAPQASRVRDELHPWLRPSGYIGQSAGIVSLLIFVFLWLYPLRKKWKALAFTGSIGKWLDVHVTAALILPLLLAIHAAWHSDGVIGLGLIAMLVVIASGVVGRYLYTRIPRAKSGVELTREEVAVQRRELVEHLAEVTGLDEDAVERALDLEPEATGHESPLSVIWHLLTNDLTRWRRMRTLRQRWTALAPGQRPLNRKALGEAVRIAGREISLAQQTRMLDATQRVFRYWHVAHRPFAITALVAVVIHVVVVVAIGATWFR
jgi:hypothetical protein